MGLKQCIYSTDSPLSPTHLWLLCSNFFNPSKKNSFGYAANRKIGNRKSQRLISSLFPCDISFTDKFINLLIHELALLWYMLVTWALYWHTRYFQQQQQKSLRELAEENGHGGAVLETRKFSPIVVEPANGQRAQQSSLPTSRRGSPRQEAVEVSVTPSSPEQTPLVRTLFIQTSGYSVS
jgi:hypothetical protein